MKTNLKFMLFILLAGITPTVIAQPAEVSGFWVVVGNIKQPYYTIIRFYDPNLMLIKEERVNGKFLDIRKKQNQKMLNRKLEELMHPRLQVVSYRKRKMPY
jgi:hypothetical protein